MTGPRRLSHELAEELISASLSGDLSDAERADLDAHLAGCDRCRATAASFAESRRLLSGVRHVPAPRDLGARVRSGVERGRFQPLPWWRRTPFAVASVGALAAAVLALAVVIGLPDANPPVATSSPLASGATPTPSATPSVTPTPSASVEATPEPPLAPLPPDYRIEYAFDVPDDITQGTTLSIVDQATGAVVRALPAGDQILAGVPTEAKLSPDGSWLALRLFQDGKGVDLLYAVQLDGDGVVLLGESLPDPFARRLLWSPDGRYLVGTVVDPDTAAADVVAFDPATGDTVRLTGTGTGYAGSWESDTILWVTLAGAEPASYRFDLSGGMPEDGGAIGSTEPPIEAFVPLVSPDGDKVILWRGAMEPTEGGWRFANGGVLVMTTTDDLGVEAPTLDAPLFVDLDGTLDEAQIAWAPDSDAYAVWNAVSSDAGDFANPSAVYFGHLSSDEPLLTDRQLLDAADLPEGTRVQDVALAPDGRHLAITASFPMDGDLARPVAELRLVTRNFGLVPDEVEVLGPAEIWVGPGIYAP